MNDVWNSLQSAAVASLNPLWDDFAKEGKESAVFAPLGFFPNAASWLAKSMAISTDCVTRKLAAMLAGWVSGSKHVDLLPEMLDHARKLFPRDRIDANSVAEDIMFAATRWTQSNNPEVGNAGRAVLANMITDALGGTSWNTVHWAVANLYRATSGACFIKVKHSQDTCKNGCTAKLRLSTASLIIAGFDLAHQIDGG